MPRDVEYRKVTDLEFRNSSRKYIAKVNRVAWYDLNKSTKYYIPKNKNWSPFPTEQSFASIERYVLVIDLKEYAVGLYSDGELIDWTNMLAGKSTPKGEFLPLKFDKEHESGLYKTPDGRKSPMPFAIQFKGNYYIHGGDVIAPQHLSHGCINIPNYFAEFIFITAKDNKNNFRIIIK